MQEINLYDLLKHYAKYWLFITICTVIGLSAGLLYNNYVQVPMYKSNATLLVVNSGPVGTAEKTTAINNYLELLKSRRVLEPVVNKLQLDQSYEQLVGAVTTSNDKDTEVVKLTIATPDPSQSQKIVDATIASFKTEITRLYKTDTIQVIDSANLPESAYNARTTIQLGIFTVAGFLFAIIVVFFIYDYRLNSVRSVALISIAPATDSPAISQIVESKKPKVVAQPKRESALVRFKNRRSAKKTSNAIQKQSRIEKAQPVRDPRTGKFAPRVSPSSHKKTSTNKRGKKSV